MTDMLGLARGGANGGLRMSDLASTSTQEDVSLHCW